MSPETVKVLSLSTAVELAVSLYQPFTFDRESLGTIVHSYLVL